MTAEVAVRPSSARATATTRTRSLVLNFAGSRNARYGGSGSTARRLQEPEPRRTAKLTLTGSEPRPPASIDQSVLWPSAVTVSVGFAGALAGMVRSAVSTAASRGSSVTRSLPSASLRVDAGPRAAVQRADGVAVVTRAAAGPKPPFNATTVSLRVAGSIRLTTQ